ncbi:hypothetical protein GCM10010343_35320 [Streptomyces avidinii]|nr:hypothetical protein GCM10010343_35320 [Streptomyces avidinii]
MGRREQPHRTEAAGGGSRAPPARVVSYGGPAGAPTGVALADTPGNALAGWFGEDAASVTGLTARARLTRCRCTDRHGTTERHVRGGTDVEFTPAPQAVTSPRGGGRGLPVVPGTTRGAHGRRLPPRYSAATAN